MLHHGPRSVPPDLRPLKKKGFKEDRVTTIGLYAIGTSTTLESNKSLARLREALGSAIAPDSIGFIAVKLILICRTNSA